MIETASTFAAVLTPVAPGAIAVIALAGPEANSIIRRVCRKKNDAPLTNLATNRPRLMRIVDVDETIDDVVVVAYPESGVARVDLFPHGGVRVVHRVMRLLERNGACCLSPAEFGDRFGERNTLRRDVDKALVRSESRRLTHWLLAQRRWLPSFFADWDHHDATTLAGYRSRTDAAIRLVRGLRVAVVGPPNAGKSTLANRLIGHDRVIVSETAGTTRDWVEEMAVMDGWPVTLTDTAGIRATDCAIEAESIRRGTGRAHASDLALIVLDTTESVTDRDRALKAVENVLGAQVATLTVLNKVDCAEEDAVVAGRDATYVSARTGEGMDRLELRIAAALGLDELASDLPTGFLPAHLNGRAETVPHGSSQ